MTDERAAGDLRSVLWRMRAAGIEVLASDQSTVWLDTDVLVDVEVLRDWSDRLLGGNATAADLDVSSGWLDGLDLLPGWYDDWALMERERLRQRTLHTLERLSAVYGGLGRFAEAVDTALMEVNADPLRESAQRALIGAHLLEGNVVEARRAYFRYQGLARRELGVAPSTSIRRMLWPDAAPCREAPATPRDR